MIYFYLDPGLRWDDGLLKNLINDFKARDHARLAVDEMGRGHGCRINQCRRGDVAARAEVFRQREFNEFLCVHIHGLPHSEHPFNRMPRPFRDFRIN